MKKAIVISASAIILLSSCKKEQTCTCYYNGKKYATTTITATKRGAKRQCDVAIFYDQNGHAIFTTCVVDQ